MSNVSLRVYNREIETMIEGGRLDEAVAHCQNILKTFPMYVETYRLLGKSFLEARRYTDAADIFQRTLMAVPDDFVAHVGMSIIRDDEGQLDNAIWHMERAFEDQPSNTAIQNELRRLYGRRDGIEPPKIRLSRDALANMYAQGELFNQAIAEIRSVLAEDPNRPDLQVMLARAYFRSGQKVEAAEAAANLLKKYNYCVDALRILVDVLPEASKTENTQVYRQRLHMLDPYSSFVAGSVFSTDQVPDASVNLERLEYVAGATPASPRPNWASTLGIKLVEEKRSESAPEWMTTKEPTQKAAEKSAEKPAVKAENPEPGTPAIGPVPAGEDKSVPEWMRSAGWKESTGNVPEEPVEMGAQKLAEPLEKGDIPEWLKSMAPQGVPEASSALEQEPVKPASSNEGDVPEWLKGLGSVAPVEAHPAPSQSITAPLEGDVFPDWLKEMDGPPQSAPAEVTPEEKLEQSFSKEPPFPTEPAPPQPDLEASTKPESTSGGWGNEEVPFQPQSEAKPPKIEDDAMAWLESLSTKQDAKEEDLLTKPDERTEEMPDWLRSGGISSTPTEQVSPVDETFPLEPLPTAEGDLGIQKPFSPEVPPVNLAGEPVQPINIPTEPIIPGEEIGQINQNPKMEDFQPEISSPMEFTSPVTPGEEAVQPLINEEDSNAWLNNLMAGQITQPAEIQPTGGAPSDELIGEKPPEDTLPPIMPGVEIEDLRDESATGQSYLPEELQTPAVTPSEEFPPETLPEGIPKSFPFGDETGGWLGGSITEENAQPEELQPAADIPVEEVLPVKPTEASQLPSSLDVDTDAWLESPEMSGQITLGEELPPISSKQGEAQPEWMQTPTREPVPADKVAAPEVPSSAPAEEDITITSWLNKHDVEAALGKTRSPSKAAPSKELPKEDLPDWLKEPEQQPAPEQAQELTAASENAPQKVESMPDWLNQSSQPIGTEAETVPGGDRQPTQGTPSWVDEGAPLIESPTPTTPGEWISVDEKPVPAPGLAPSPKPVAPSVEPPFQRQILGGTGMLSRVPPEDKDSEFLSAAQTALDAKEIKKSMQEYAKLIKKNRLLDEVIHDLREAIYRFPVDINIWQTLGDASMRANRLQDALDAYTKAEELLR